LIKTRRRGARSLPHHDVLTVSDEIMEKFSTLQATMNKRQQQSLLTSHSIVRKVAGVKTGYFELGPYLNSEIRQAALSIIKDSPRYPHGEPELVPFRGLMNLYESSITLTSRDHSPLMEPHRDNVQGAVAAIVLGLTPPNDYSGCLLFVSTSKRGNITFNSNTLNSVEKRAGVASVNASRGVAVVLWDNVEHYVGQLQQGRRESIVIHFKRE